MFQGIFVIAITLIVMLTSWILHSNGLSLRQSLICLMLYAFTNVKNNIIDRILIALGACQLLVTMLNDCNISYSKSQSLMVYYLKLCLCKAIENLSLRIEAKENLIRVKTCNPIIAAMKSHLSNKRIVQACSIIVAKMSLDNADNTNQLIEIDATDTLLASISSHIRDITIVGNISQTLYTVSSGSYAIRYKLSESGGCKIFTTALHLHKNNTRICQYICAIISNLAACGESERLQLFKNKVCEELVFVLRIHSKDCEVVSNACSAIHFLALLSDAKATFKTANVAVLVNDAIRDHGGNVDVFTHANSALTRL